MTDRIDTLLTARAAEAPDGLALRDIDGAPATYGDHDGAVARAAETLRDAGLRPGDRLVIVAENCRATATLIFAASRAGAVAVPVNARMTEAELTRVIDHADPRLVAFTTAVSPEAQAHADRMGAAPAMDGVALAVRGDAAADDGLGAVAVLLYTTGTTGAPKGVMLTHRNLSFAGETSAVLRGMTPGDVIYGVLPMTHVFGLASMLMAASHAGAAVRMETRFRPDRLYAALTDDVSVFPGVPQMHALLMAHVAQQGHDRLTGGRLRYVSSGAAPLDPAWKRKAEAFYGLPLQNGYGMTESTAGVSGTRNPIGSPDISVGAPLPGIELRLDEAQGGGEPGVGEILTRGPHIMAGYYRAPDITAQTVDADGWLRTGDLGRMEDGRLHVVGRSKELIIRGGFNVYPPEVEAALNDHPAVVQSAVIGRRLPGGDEEVLAFVQCADPDAIDLRDLAAFAATRLAGYKRPTHIVPVTALPAASTGKILKHRLATVFADDLARIDERTAFHEGQRCLAGNRSGARPRAGAVRLVRSLSHGGSAVRR